MKHNNPQIALRNQTSWAVIGPYWRITGVTVETMPKVNCPIIDTRHAKKDEVTRLVQKYVAIEGVQNVDLFITDLMAIGCMMVLPVDLHEFSISMPSRV